MFEFKSDRDSLQNWIANKTEAELQAYRAENNGQSLDGLPGLDAVSSDGSAT